MKMSERKDSIPTYHIHAKPLSDIALMVTLDFVTLAARQISPTRPSILVRAAAKLEDRLKLTNIALAHQNRLAFEHFGKQASGRT